MKRTPLRKTAKKKTPGWYKKKLWTEFSIFIRRRDKGQCFTCGLKKHWKEMQAGHMIPRSVGGASLYFHEKNVHCQCYACNINYGGNGAIYAQNFISVYGQEEFDEIMRLKSVIYKYPTIREYEELIKHYKELNNAYGLE